MKQLSPAHALPDDQAPLLRRDTDGVCVLTLNRPRQFNAFTLDLLDSLDAALETIAADGGVRVLVITGSGRAFCAGCDLKQMRADYTEQFVGSVFGACSRMMQKLQTLPQPVVAAVNGLTTAAGCELVASCDLAVAVSSARFAVSGVNLGLFCSTPAVPLSRNIGRKRAMEMLLTGDFIDAQTAQEWGLVNRVVPDDRLWESVEELAHGLMAKPAKTLALGKALFYRQIEQPVAPAYEDASRTITLNMMDSAAAEGVDAFIQKRSPRWDK